MTSAIIPSRTADSDDVDLYDMFGDLPPMDPSDVKKDQIAADLAALMAFSGSTRSEMADRLGWKKSRITSVLSGRENVTIKTICEFSSRLGYDFDLVFHKANERRPIQPWQKVSQSAVSSANLPRGISDFKILVHMQTASEVARDFSSGYHKGLYFSIEIPGQSTRVASRSVTTTKIGLPSTQAFSAVPIDIEEIQYAKK